MLLYEIGFCGEYKDEEGNHQVREWEFVRELLDQKISDICEAVFNKEEPTLYLSATPSLVKQWNRIYDDNLVWKPNFRIELSTKKGYKTQRKQEKPFHYHNIAAYLLGKYTCKLAIGIEADDAMAMDQRENTIICSRDKDLRQVEGWHYSWPCGKQLAIGPMLVDKLGSISIGKGKILGTGLKFFYSQIITGDPVDNIPGLPGYGPVKAYNLLHDCNSERELYEVVQTCYKIVYGEDWEKELREQANLVWMVRDMNGEEPVMYEFPK